MEPQSNIEPLSQTPSPIRKVEKQLSREKRGVWKALLEWGNSVYPVGVILKAICRSLPFIDQSFIMRAARADWTSSSFKVN